MYLILGSALDPCCAQVNSELKARGHHVRVIEDLLSEPHHFVWRFPGRGPLGMGTSRIGVPGKWQAGNDDIEGVLVRDTCWYAVNDWSEKDAQYMSAEMQAALLGWLWSLPGIVVNRVPAWLFYRPRPSLLYWVPLLHRAGLRTPVTVISNDKERLKDWRTQHTDGSIFSPLSSQMHFPLQTDTEWEGAMRVAQHAPVLLGEAHGETRLACVVGDCVVWDGAATAETWALEVKLRSFARIAGLDFVQIAVTEQLEVEQCYAARYAVVSVEAQVQFHLFCNEAQKTIAEVLANLLTGSQRHVRGRRPIEARHAVLSGWCAR